MSARRFRVVFERDGEGWHVFVPDVKGCHTGGDSLDEARRNIREALSTCIDVFADADAIARDAIFDEEIR